MKTKLIFEGAGRWDGGDTPPWDDTPFPRVPVVDERLIFPDETEAEAWIVRSVTYDFEQGLYHEPLVVVALSREQRP